MLSVQKRLEKQKWKVKEMEETIFEGILRLKKGIDMCQEIVEKDTYLRL